MVKVLRVMGGLDVGGVEMGVLNFLRRVDPGQVKTTIYCLQSGDTLLSEIEALGTEVIFAPHTGNPFRTSKLLEIHLKRFSPDVVHCHNLFFAGWIMRAAHRAGVPLRLTHANSTGDRKKAGLIQPLYHALMRRMIHRHATARLAVSRDAARFLFGTDPAEVITSGIDTETFMPRNDTREIRNELGFDPDVRVIGHVGNLRPEKNHQFLLKIVAEMLRHRQDLQLVLVGEGALRQELETQAHELGIASKVSFLGTRTDVPRLMGGLFDTFLFPSAYEGMGQVIVQAQAAGLPVIASANLPRETEVVPELVRWVDLDSPPTHWADQVLASLDSMPIDRLAAHEKVRASVLDISHTVRRLTAIYQGGAMR
jgi:glycosyltransferase involved in cell wall biosynthesis